MTIDVDQLRGFISNMYSDVASYPRATFHFPTGRPLMERLGYPGEKLDRIPTGAMASYAGVGYHFGLDPLKPGETVLDIGSGAGSDAFYAALDVGDTGRVIGIDMTPKMTERSRENLAESGMTHLSFEPGLAEDLPGGEEAYDCVVSNGVLNLIVDKNTVFDSIKSALKPGGRLMFSDIVTGVELPESVRENCELWAECIGGAEQRERYVKRIESAGLRVEAVQENDTYRFTEGSTADAARRFQVTSVRILAYRP